MLTLVWMWTLTFSVDLPLWKDWTGREFKSRVRSANSFSAWHGLSRFECKSNVITISALLLSFTHTHTLCTFSQHTHMCGYLQHPLPMPYWLIRSLGSQIHRLLLPVSLAWKVTDSDSIQSKIMMMMIKKGKKRRKEKGLCGLISARLMSAAGVAGLYALEQASRRSRNLLTSDDQHRWLMTHHMFWTVNVSSSPYPTATLSLVCACVINTSFLPVVA